MASPVYAIDSTTIRFSVGRLAFEANRGAARDGAGSWLDSRFWNNSCLLHCTIP
jgi:hypothetical protein